jgi:hypothetical protein
MELGNLIKEVAANSFSGESQNEAQELRRAEFALLLQFS